MPWTMAARFAPFPPHMQAMNLLRTPLLPLLLALAACGRSDPPPEAKPGAVERTTDALDRNAAAERNQTVERIDNEAEARAADSKQRIEAIEREGAETN